MARVASEFSTTFEVVQGGVTAALGAVSAAASALNASGSEVAGALEGVFATRRLTGPGLGVHAEDVLTGVRDATVAYVAGDEQMATETSARADASEPSVPWRGFGPRVS